MRLPFHLPLLAISVAFAGPSCSSSDVAPTDPNAPFTGADVGPEGGEVIAPASSDFAGIRLKIPAGALSAKVRISFQGLVDETPLPDTAERVGPAVKILPEGTVLSKPAELTLPLDREMVNAYNQTATDCKVWARKDAGWERIGQLRSDADSITIPISKLTTAAAGVNFSIRNSCIKFPCEPAKPVITTFQSLAQICEPVDNAPYCLIRLPLAEKPRGIDEFASLNIIARKVYWVANTDDGVTIARYDLDKPTEPFFKYPAYTGSVNGTLATRGIVSVGNDGSAWIGLSGVGNVRFAEGQAPILFDTGRAAGVASTTTGVIRRFARQNVVNNGRVSKTDVRVYSAVSDDSDFSFNYPITPGESIMAFGDAQALPHLFIRSTHRGLAETYRSSGLNDFMTFNAQDGNFGSSDDNDPSTFGSAAFNANFSLGAIVKGARVQLRSGNGFKTVVQDFGPPGGARDVAFDAVGTLHAVSSNAELYRLLPTGAVQSFQLPESEPGMVPWRLRNLPGTQDLLLITRGELIAKGAFYILRPATIQ